MKQNFKVLLLLADDKIMYVKKDCCNFFLLQLNQILRLNLNKGWVGFMVFNATVNNISVISWRSALLVEETGVPGENHRPAVSHIMLYRVHLA